MARVIVRTPYIDVDLRDGHAVDYAVCARGRYQQALLAGRLPWSGAGMRGRARAWGTRYERSRARLILRLAEAFAVKLVRRDHGRLVLVVRELGEDDDEPLAMNAATWRRVMKGENHGEEGSKH